MNELKELKQQKYELSIKISAIEDAQRAKNNIDMVGKCYKLNDSYLYDEIDVGWWNYVIIHCADKHGEINATQFEIDDSGKVEIEKIDHFSQTDGYIEIEMSELLEAWKNTLDHAHSMFESGE